MPTEIPAEAERYTAKNRLRRVWQKFVRAMACIVVFCTTYALILPAITLQRQAICLMDEHEHGLLCYTQVTTESVAALPCTYESLGVHVHSEQCLDENGQRVCGYADYLIHSHDALCTDADGTLLCALPVVQAHTHDDSCYGLHTHAEDCYETARGALRCTLHVHDDSCYDPGQPVCGVTEEDHSHEAACYAPALVCQEPDHTHEDGCYVTEQTLVCTLTENTEAPAQPLCGLGEVIAHSHSEGCYEIYTDEAGAEQLRLACALPATRIHDHDAACFTTVEIPLDDLDTLTCTEEHLHIDRCYGTWALTCGKEEHTHVESCYPAEPEPEYSCGLTAHTHSEDCYDAEGVLQCILEEHSHEEAGCELVVDQDAAYVNYLIENIPSADEIDARLAEFESAGDAEGEEAWYTEVSRQVAQAYHSFSLLSEAQAAQVTDAGKLLALEHIWSVTPYSSVITSTKPTATWYTSTKDFVELNLYDYNYGINTNYFANKKYPGFQWNGGAYAKNTSDNASADLGIANTLVSRYVIDNIDFGNSLVENFDYTAPSGDPYGKSTSAVLVGKLYNNSGAADTGRINWLWYDGSDYKSATNRPIGMSTGYDAMNMTLVNGYPALADGTSLAYLFTPGEAVTKKNTATIDGLFQQNAVTGAYTFNSRENHAQYADNFFTLYNEIITPNFITYPFGNFLPLNTISDGTKATQVSAFNYNGGMKQYVEGIIADLDAATAGQNADVYGYKARKQLKTMLQEYAEGWNINPWRYGDGSVWMNWNNLSPANAIRDYFWGGGGSSDNPSSNTNFITAEHLQRMYNIDWDVPTNFFFGMEMKMNFMQPKDGMTGEDNGSNSNALTPNANGDLVRAGNPDGIPDYPMVFEFTGDDDVWVYVDDILFLDLSGIHRHVGGKIDFVNGIVSYYELSPANGDVGTTAYKTYSFAALMRAAGKTEAQIDEVLKPMQNYNRPFKDYTTHTFNFYYTERGSGSSVCRMNFNFPMLRQESITVTKQNVPDQDVTVLGDPDYYFSIIPEYNAEKPVVGPNSVTGISTYTILDSAGVNIGTGKVDEYGIFKLKAGQSAVFTGINENIGQFHVQELIRESDDDQYMKAININGSGYRNGNLIQWKDRPWFTGDTGADGTLGPYGSRWYAYSSQKTDASASSTFYFEAQNGVKTANLGSLSITKRLELTQPDYADGRVYRMIVRLDGKELPEGTPYTVDGEARTVETAGEILLRAGQTAVISNILSGTSFEVSEHAQSAEGFAVGYALTGTEEYQTGTNSISGTIRVNDAVAVTVTNTDTAVELTIPAVKTLVNGSPDKTHPYSFTLTQVDAKGDPVTGGYTHTAEAQVTGGGSGSFAFRLYYRDCDYAEETAFPVRYYYQIQEDPGDRSFLPDGAEYLVQVEVNRDSDTGSLTAVKSITKDGQPWEDEEPLRFTNTLVQELTIRKTVEGGTAYHDTVDYQFDITFSGTAVPQSLTVSDGKTVEKTGDGQFRFTLRNGEAITIRDLPCGLTWTVTESFPPGSNERYDTSNTHGDGVNAGGTVTDGVNDEVVYTNTVRYTLPETGGVPIPYTMVGLTLMLFSAVCLMYTQLKRRREAR